MPGVARYAGGHLVAASLRGFCRPPPLSQGGEQVSRPQNISHTLVGPQVSLSLKEVVHQSRGGCGNTCRAGGGKRPVSFIFMPSSETLHREELNLRAAYPQRDHFMNMKEMKPSLVEEGPKLEIGSCLQKSRDGDTRTCHAPNHKDLQKLRSSLITLSPWLSLQCLSLISQMFPQGGEVQKGCKSFLLYWSERKGSGRKLALIDPKKRSSNHNPVKEKDLLTYPKDQSQPNTPKERSSGRDPYPEAASPQIRLRKEGNQVPPLLVALVNCFHLCSQSWLCYSTRCSIIGSGHDLVIPIHGVESKDIT
ncbi:uncharacterized protein LOC107312754 [Coturnix japonica]|uniref:uncharacterized protein LOC107312754 n=1 Tax=Coturnix japonica TaxID=93934 RepID=UPI00077802D0|nr:uncharacterized protein LOC107312754 [Coturnix japonica]